MAFQQIGNRQEEHGSFQQRGPHDPFGAVELGLIGEVAAELRRIAAGLGRQLGPQREADHER